MHELTPRQSQILDYIKRYLQETGYPPTRSEIAAEMGYRSANAAEEHLRALARKGYIEMIAGASRGMRVVGEQPEGLPVVGQVAAGSPILAQECIAEYCAVPGDLFSPAADYLLTVKGDSMIDAGIHEGDLLAVQKSATARDGQIIVGRLDEDVTVKRLRHTDSRHRLLLLAENRAYEPIEVDLRSQQFTIEGISVGVIRRGSL